MAPSSALKQDDTRPGQEILVLPKGQHRQFPEYKVFLHVFKSQKALSSFIASVDQTTAVRDDVQQLGPGQIVAVCLKGMQELHSFHLLVFGVVDMDKIEQGFPLSRSKLRKKAIELHLGNNEWKLGTMLLKDGEAVATAHGLPASSDKFIDFGSELAMLANNIIEKSLVSSVHNATSRLRASVERPPVIGSPQIASYSSVVGTSLPGTTSQWTSNTTDDTSLPCLSFEWSAYTMQDSSIEHCLGYSVPVSESGVAVLLNRRFPVHRSHPISAIQLIPSTTLSRPTRCGLLSGQGNIQRFSALPQLNQNATHTETLREIETVEKAVAVMRKRHSQGSVEDTERFLATLRDSTDPLTRSSIDSAGKLLDMLDELAKHKKSGITSIASKARSCLASAVDSNDSDKRASAQLQETFQSLISIGQAASQILSGWQPNDSDLNLRCLLDTLTAAQEPATPSVELVQDVETPSRTRVSHQPLSIDPSVTLSTTRQARSVSSKRKYSIIEIDEDEESEIGSVNQGSDDEDGDVQPIKKRVKAKQRKKTNERSNKRAVKEIPREGASPFDNGDYRQALQEVFQPAYSSNRAAVFIETWSSHLKAQAREALRGLQDAVLEKPPTTLIDPPIIPHNTTKAALAKHQVSVFERQMELAEHYEGNPMISQWFKLVAIQRTLEILTDLSDEIATVYQRVDLLALKEALESEKLGYSKPLIDVIMYLSERLAKVSEKTRDKGEESEQVDGTNLPKNLAESLDTNLRPGHKSSQSRDGTSSSSRHSQSPDAEDYSNVSISPLVSRGKDKRSKKEIFQSLVKETLLQIYYPRVLDCLASTNMNGEPLSVVRTTWHGRRRFLTFRVDLITRLAKVGRSQITGTPAVTGVNVSGIDIFAIIAMSQMVFAPGHVFPMPTNRNNDRKFYDYTMPYNFPDMLLGKYAGKERAKLSELEEEEKAATSKLAWDLTFRIIANAFADIDQVAKKLRSLLDV